MGIYLATFPKKGLVVSDLEVRMPFGPEFDARKDDMAWNGNLVATAWKDYLRWIVLDSGAGNLLIIREITDTMEALGAGVPLPPGRAAWQAAEKTKAWVDEAKRSRAASASR